MMITETEHDGFQLTSHGPDVARKGHYSEVTSYSIFAHRLDRDLKNLQSSLAGKEKILCSFGLT